MYMLQLYMFKKMLYILKAIKRNPRQGKPKTIYYDNGTNFQGASNQWHEVYNMLQCFPQKDPEFLGQWRMWLEVHSPIWTPLQRLMGSSCDIHETPLKLFIRNTNAIYEELCTLLSEKEACLNSRPLCAYLKAGLHMRGKFASPIESI